jgi:ADP-heptose:LPS heptosyltransferase
MARQPRMVVLRALGLGDLLTAVPALRALARAFPEHRRLLAAPGALAPLLPLIEEAGQPCLRGLLVVDGLEAEPPTPIPAPDVAVNLHGRGPQSHRLLLATRPARLLAFRHEQIPESTAMPPWHADEHEVERWCRLLEEAGIAADPAELAIRPPPGPVPEWARGATLIHPGAASPARRWPAERWAAVARAQREAGRAVVLTGSADEAGLARRIASEAGLDPGCIAAGTTDLLDLAALVGVAGAVVCGDTGVGHLATALATPSVLLFGPTSPRRWGPPADRPRHRVLWAGRSGDPHGAVPDPGLLEIAPGAVLEELQALQAVAAA